MITATARPTTHPHPRRGDPAIAPSCQSVPPDTACGTRRAMHQSMGSAIRRRGPSRVAARPGDEALASAGCGRWYHCTSEYPGAAHLAFGDRLEDDAGELDGLVRDHDVPTGASSQVPGMDEEVQGRKAQAVADGAPTDGRIHHHCKVDVRNRCTGGSDERFPPRARLPRDRGTWRIDGRPLGLSPGEELGTEPNGRADVAKDIQGRPPRTWRWSVPVGRLEQGHGRREEAEPLDESGIRFPRHLVTLSPWAAHRQSGRVAEALRAPGRSGCLRTPRGQRSCTTGRRYRAGDVSGAVRSRQRPPGS